MILLVPLLANQRKQKFDIKNVNAIKIDTYVPQKPPFMILYCQPDILTENKDFKKWMKLNYVIVEKQKVKLLKPCRPRESARTARVFSGLDSKPMI